MHFAFCQGGQEGTWRSQMAYLFPQETRCDSAGHLPSSGQGESRLFQEELVPVPSPEKTALSPSCLLHSQGFLPETAFLKRLERGWKGRMGKDNRVNLWPLPRHTFCSFNPTEIRNQKPRMKRHGTTSVKPWAPRGCMCFPGFWVFMFLPCCCFPTSTFEKPSSLTGQAQGTYLYAAQISESVLSLCRVKNGLHFLDSPCGCKE